VIVLVVGLVVSWLISFCAGVLGSVGGQRRRDWCSGSVVPGGGSLMYAGAAAFLAGRCGVWPGGLSLLRSYGEGDSCCLGAWLEWMGRPAPGEFWLRFPGVVEGGRLGGPAPPGWPLWRTTCLCATSPLRMLSKWPWMGRCGDYWQQAELCTDAACRIMMMMMMCRFCCVIAVTRDITLRVFGHQSWSFPRTTGSARSVNT